MAWVSRRCANGCRTQRSDKHRVIELVADEYDLPPVSWCWMLFGSEGRVERVFAGDQDNGLIFLPDNEVGHAADPANCCRLGGQSCARSMRFHELPGNIMAGNPAWCLSVAEWRARFGSWMTTPGRGAVECDDLFDFRPLYGQDELVDSLHRWLLPQPEQNPRFLRAMTEQALGCTPALGWFGNFSCDGGRRYPHTIDLKSYGGRPFVDAARIWGLRHGVWTTNTVERLREAGPLMNRHRASDTAAAVEAFDVVQRLRFAAPAGVAETMMRSTGFNPSHLTAPQRTMLKEAFHQAKLLQLRLRQEFLQ